MRAIKKMTMKRHIVGVRVVLIFLTVVLGVSGNSFSAHALDNDYTWSKLASGDVYSNQSATSSNGKDSVVAGDTTVITHDSGATWQDLGDTLAAVPGNTPNNWYNGAGMSADGSTICLLDRSGQLYLSTNSGATWSLKATPMTSSNRIAMSADGTKLAVATGNSVYISDDSGSTWTQRANGSGISSITMSANGQILLGSLQGTSSYGSDGGIYRSTDGGVTWTQNASTGTLALYNLQLSAAGQVAIAQSNTDSVYVSKDGGMTWSEILGAPVAGYNMYLSSDASTILVFDGYTRYKSSDDGVTWTTQPSNADGWVRGGGGSGSANLSVLVGVDDDYGNLFASQDGGMTWQVPLLEGNSWWAGMTTSTDGSTVLLTDADGHIYYSHDHGTTWQFGYDVSDDGDNTGGDLWGSAVSTDGSHMVVSDDDPNAHLLTSSDGGATWVKNTAAGVHDWYDVALSADGSKIAAITKSGDVYLSTNFGVSWNVVTSLEPDFPTTDGQSGNIQTRIVMSPDGTHLAVDERTLSSTYNSTTKTWSNTGTSHLYTSGDGGSTWTLQATPADSGLAVIQDIAMSSDGKTLAFVTLGDTSHLYLSTNGGATWTLDPGTGLSTDGKSSATYDHLSMSNNGQDIAASDYTYNDMYTTSDGGATWKTYSNNDPVAGYASGEVPIAVSGDGTQIYTATNNVFRGALAGTDTTGSSSSGATLPTAPQQIRATPTSMTDLKVTWQAPVDEGSSPITMYRIRYRVAGTSNWIPAGETSASMFAYTITGLNPTTTYDVQVAAVSALGASTDVPSQANDATATATTLRAGQAAPAGSSSMSSALADTGANTWLFAGMGVTALMSGVLMLRRFSKR